MANYILVAVVVAAAAVGGDGDESRDGIEVLYGVDVGVDVNLAAAAVAGGDDDDGEDGGGLDGAANGDADFVGLLKIKKHGSKFS